MNSIARRHRSCSRTVRNHLGTFSSRTPWSNRHAHLPLSAAGGSSAHLPLPSSICLSDLQYQRPPCIRLAADIRQVPPPDPAHRSKEEATCI